MNSHNNFKYDPFSRFIGQSMKNWLEQQNPPADAREELLRAASKDSLKKPYFHRIFQLFLQGLFPKMASVLSLGSREYSKYSHYAHNLQLENTHANGWGAYQLIFRSIPVGLGLLRFLN